VLEPAKRAALGEERDAARHPVHGRGRRPHVDEEQRPVLAQAGDLSGLGDLAVRDRPQPGRDDWAGSGGKQVLDAHPEQLVPRVAEQGAGGRVHPAIAVRRGVGDEDRFGRALEDRAGAAFGCSEGLLHAVLLGDVRNRAQHPNRPARWVEVERAAPVHPAVLTRVDPHDPVLPVEGLRAAQDLVAEVGDHRLAVLWVHERGPAFDRPLERGVDPEDGVEAL
jgi:hypothetical protein